MDPESPPRKKLKQARLPFQVLSHKKTVIEQSGGSKKRKLSEGCEDDVQVMKVIKSTEIEEAKENKSLKCKDSKEKSVGGNEGKKPSVEEDSEIEVVCEATHAPGNDDSLKESTKSHMKMKLSALFGKKHSASVEKDTDVDSAEEVTEETNLTPDIGGKRKRSLRNPGDTNLSKKASNHKSVTEIGNKVESAGADNCQSDLEPVDIASVPKGESKVEITVNEVEVRINDEVKGKGRGMEEKSEKVNQENNTEKKSLLKKKTMEMFAAWRKTPSCTAAGKATSGDQVENQASPEKAVEAKESENERENICKDKHPDLEHDNQREEIRSVETEQSKEIGDEESTELKSVMNDHGMELGKDNSSASISGEKTSSEIVKVDLDTSEGIIQLSDDESSELKTSELKDLKDIVVGSVTPKSLGKTPQRRLTPKQVERLKESARKQEEREKLKQEKEKEKQRMKLEKEEQKKKEKEEKEEQKKKEKEEKEEQKRKEKEEKERKRLAELEQKTEEKRKKDELKAEEKRKREEEKKKVEEEEERKKAKASAMFTSFFVAKTSKSEREDSLVSAPTVQNFMPFEVKAGMQIAPQIRLTLSSEQKQYLDNILHSNISLPPSELYVESVRSGKVCPHSSGKTWRLEENDDEEVCVLEPDDSGMFVIEPKNHIEKLRTKRLQFHENHRPPYFGTWRKKSSAVTGRKPFGQDKVLDYEVDSADEWEEEEPGESLHGSDDEKEQESEDEYEVDNSVFVPHGYLSEDEGDDEIENEVLSPETQKAKLKLLGEEFEAQMKSKTSALKPVIIVLTAAMQANALGSARYQKLLERRAVWREDEGPILLSLQGPDGETNEGVCVGQTDSSQQLVSSGPGARRKLISEEAIPALITLVHGNRNKRLFLVHEFSAFLGKYKTDTTPVKEKVSAEDSAVTDSPIKPGVHSTPTTIPVTSGPNRMLSKWPYLPPASRASISKKIKELASWGLCPEEGPMVNRQCWYVPQEIRMQYGLSDLKIPNSEWDYTLKPKQTSSQLNANSPTAKSSAGSNSITKFTKILTPEEKQREWNLLSHKKMSSPAIAKSVPIRTSAGKITSFTCPLKTVSTDPKPSSKSYLNSPSTASCSSAGATSKTPSSAEPQAKKRVPLLVSVPRGQQIIRSAHCSLLSKFEAAASNSSSVSDSISGNTQSEKSVDCIILD